MSEQQQTGAARVAPQTITCHSCGGTTHGEHMGPCAMCDEADRAWCCECWEAEDTSCGADAGDLGYQD